MNTLRRIHKAYPRAVKLKGVLSGLETAREVYEYSGFKKKHEMALAYYYKQRLRGTKYGRRRLVVVTPSRSPPRKKFRTVRVRNSYRKYKSRFSRRNIGERVGTSNVKNFEIAGTQQINTRTLYSATLVAVGRGPGISERMRDVINLRGFDINFDVRNDQTDPNKVMFMNIAVLAPKDRLDIDVQDFFRSQSDLNERALDFSIFRTAVQFHRLPVNTDKFTILKHKRYTLNPKQAGIRGFRFSTKMYIPLKRQLAYAGTANSTCTTPVFMVWWCDYMFNDTNQQPEVNSATIQYRVVTYFRETPN